MLEAYWACAAQRARLTVRGGRQRGGGGGGGRRRRRRRRRHAGGRDESLQDEVEFVELVGREVVLALGVRRRRYRLDLHQVDAVRHADGDHADAASARRLRVRDRLLLVHQRLAVRDDDRHVDRARPVAARRREDFVHRHGDARRRVRTRKRHVREASERRYQISLIHVSAER